MEKEKNTVAHTAHGGRDLSVAHDRRAGSARRRTARVRSPGVGGTRPAQAGRAVTGARGPGAQLVAQQARSGRPTRTSLGVGEKPAHALEQADPEGRPNYA